MDGIVAKLRSRVDGIVFPDELAEKAASKIEQMDKALKLVHREMCCVLSSIENEEVHVDGDDFHEALQAVFHAAIKKDAKGLEI